MNGSRSMALTSFGDERGQLVALESQKNIPFDIKRVYYIYNTSAGVSRGLHAHHDLEQVLICTQGGCTVLTDDGREQQVTRLQGPKDALYVGRLIWREMYDFTDDCVLVVLASDHYHERDYIRSYEVKA